MSATLIQRNTCRFKDFRQRPASRFKPATVGGEDLSVGVALQADDGNWYEINSYELSTGNAVVDFGQSVVPAGANAYLVIVNLTDGLKYKFRLYVDGVVTGGYDGSGATGEAETVTIITDRSGRQYQLNFITDGGNITFQLDQI